MISELLLQSAPLSTTYIQRSDIVSSFNELSTDLSTTFATKTELSEISNDLSIDLDRATIFKAIDPLNEFPETDLVIGTAAPGHTHVNNVTIYMENDLNIVDADYNKNILYYNKCSNPRSPYLMTHVSNVYFGDGYAGDTKVYFGNAYSNNYMAVSPNTVVFYEAPIELQNTTMHAGRL